MSVVLRTEQGELVMARVKVDAGMLEDALDTLATLPFPVNPELRHKGLDTEIEFPAYAGSLPEVDGAFRARGLYVGAVESTPMIEAIRER
jgi:hypothetical protein